jgi:hypothetical protein
MRQVRRPLRRRREKYLLYVYMAGLFECKEDGLCDVFGTKRGEALVNAIGFFFVSMKTNY